MNKTKLELNGIKIDCSFNPIQYDFEFDFMLFVGDDPRDLFRYYNKTEMHGLNLRDCEQRMKNGGSYIDGLVNYHPDDDGCQLAGRPFMFLNLKTMNELPIWKTASLIMHESGHLAMIIEQHFGNPDPDDFNREERVITCAETIANLVMETLKFPEIYFMIKQ
jgi:hypothetical protein